jgi:hypothetical protein
MGMGSPNPIDKLPINFSQDAAAFRRTIRAFSVILPVYSLVFHHWLGKASERLRKDPGKTTGEALGKPPAPRKDPGKTPERPWRDSTEEEYHAEKVSYDPRADARAK